MTYTASPYDSCDFVFSSSTVIGPQSSAKTPLFHLVKCHPSSSV